MKNLKKYELMLRDSVEPDRVYEIAKEDGLDGFDLYTLLKDVLGYSSTRSVERVMADGYDVMRALRHSSPAPTEKRDQFRLVFDTTLEAMARLVELAEGYPIQRNFKIELGGVGGVRNPLSPDEAFDILYLGDEEYYSIINVSVVSIKDQTITVWMQVTGHGPGPFNRTWNQPDGAGPFKFINCQGEYWDLVERTFAEIRDDITL